MILTLTSLCSREVPGTDVSSSVETDKENEDLDDTDKLLDSMNATRTLDSTTTLSRSPMKQIFAGQGTTTPRRSGADLFAEDSDIDATPKLKVDDLRKTKIFSHPEIDL